MKPAWDQLMDAFADSPTTLVADVDCTKPEGKPLCGKQSIRGYPTVLYGDPNALEKYSGGRDFNSLKTFADENLKPLCSPYNLDVCSDEQKAEIKVLQGMPVAELETAIETESQELKDAETSYQATLKTLKADFESKRGEMSAKIGLKKAVQAYAKAEVKEEL